MFYVEALKLLIGNKLITKIEPKQKKRNLNGKKKLQNN